MGQACYQDGVELPVLTLDRGDSPSGDGGKSLLLFTCKAAYQAEEAYLGALEVRQQNITALFVDER